MPAALVSVKGVCVCRWIDRPSHVLQRSIDRSIDGTAVGRNRMLLLVGRSSVKRETVARRLLGFALIRVFVSNTQTHTSTYHQIGTNPSQKQKGNDPAALGGSTLPPPARHWRRRQLAPGSTAAAAGPLPLVACLDSREHHSRRRRRRPPQQPPAWTAMAAAPTAAAPPAAPVPPQPQIRPGAVCSPPRRSG